MLPFVAATISGVPPTTFCTFGSAPFSRSFAAGRYHSRVVERDTLPDCLEVSATTTDGLIMGLRHRRMKVEGVQFHPESILTTEGKKLLANFLKL